MKKRILIFAALILALLVSASVFADGIKSKWTIIPIRGKMVCVSSEATKSVVVRWDYFVWENGKIKVQAPGAYPGAFNDKDFYQFYIEEFPIQKEEDFVLPESVYNFYVRVSSDRVKIGNWKYGFWKKANPGERYNLTYKDADGNTKLIENVPAEGDVFVEDSKGSAILITD